MNVSDSYTLITGASRGIGQALAEASAKRKKNLALVSLPGEGLPELARTLAQTEGVQVVCLEIDLSKEKAAEEVFQWAQTTGIQVDTLINNAGFGHLGVFPNHSLDFYRTMIRLNMEVPLALMHLFLPQLEAAPRGGIINMGSAAGFFPVPHKSVYSASKSFLYFISRSVQHELRHSNVHMTVVCPNGVPTNAATIARVKQLGWKGKLTTVSAEGVAEAALDGLKKRKKVVIPGRFNQFSVMLTRLLGTAYSMRFMEKQFLKELPPVEAESAESPIPVSEASK